MGLCAFCLETAQHEFFIGVVDPEGDYWKSDLGIPVCPTHFKGLEGQEWELKRIR